MHPTDSSSAINVPSIPDVIYDVLRRDISRGLYPPGRISIRQLAAEFGVSSMPVREALRRLQAEGLVGFKGGRQVIIEELTLEDLRELFAIRLELESLAIRRSVPLLSDDSQELERLDAMIATMDQVENDYDEWRVINRLFHDSLYAAAKMPRLLSTIGSLAVSVDAYAKLYGRSIDGLRVAQEQHREMMEHVRAKNEDAAAAVLRNHLEVALDVLRRAAIDGHIATE